MLQKHSIKRKISPQKVLLFGWGGFAVLGLGIAGFSSVLPSDTNAATQINATIDKTGYYLNMTASPGDIEMNVSPSATGDTMDSASDSLNVKTNIPTGYELYISATSTGETQNSLYNTYTPPEHTTDSISAVATTPASAAPLNSNTWGYGVPSGTEGLVTNQFDADYSNPTITGSHWAGVPTAIAEPIQTITHANDAVGGTNINFHYAVSANANKSSGTYTGTVIYTAIADVPEPPRPTPPSTCDTYAPGITYMQDINDTVKGNMTVDQQYFAVDKRDDKGYCIAKLQDGNIWMTQNLDLDITTEGLTSELTDLNSQTAWNQSSTYKPQTTETTTSSSSTYTDTRSWSLGDYYYDPTVNQSCGTSAHSYADCTTGFLTPDNPNIDQHYHVGNLYQYNTITAGSGASVTTQYEQAPDSICPKGWRLPKSGSTPNEFSNMLSLYGAWTSGTGGTVQNLIKEPIYMVRGGYVYSGTLWYAAANGYYWSSTAYSSYNAYYLSFYGTSGVGPDNYNVGRYNGFSARCVAR